MAEEKNSAKEVAKNMQDAVRKLKLRDEEGKELNVHSIRYLEEDRMIRYGQLSESIVEGEHVLAVECVRKSASDPNELTEKIIVFDDDEDDEPEVIGMDDMITMIEMSPSLLIEYRFNENGSWYLSPISLVSLECYRKSKFSNWRKMIEHPSCKAAFKRLLNIGLITNIFDYEVFKSPENELKDWMVKDDKGRDVKIPRPVHSLRIWDIKQRAYKPVIAHLEGAPNANDADSYWENMLNTFREQQGTDFINNLLASFKAEKENKNENKKEGKNENGKEIENENDKENKKENKNDKVNKTENENESNDKIKKTENKYIGKKRKEMDPTNDIIDENPINTTSAPPTKKIKTSQ